MGLTSRWFRSSRIGWGGRAGSSILIVSPLTNSIMTTTSSTGELETADLKDALELESA